MARLSLIFAVASLVLLSPPLRAQEDEGEGESTAQQGQAQAEVAGGAPAIPEGQALGGAGIGSSQNPQKKESGSSLNGGGGNGGGGAGGGGSGGSGSGGAAAANLTTFASWKSMPHVGGHGVYNFKGPGTGAAIHFLAEGGGMWATCETTNSTDNCGYRAWISAKPGGAPVGKNCSTEAGWLGASMNWSTGAKPASWDCALKAGGEYYFNMQLLRWGANPVNGIIACEQYIDTTSAAVMGQ